LLVVVPYFGAIAGAIPPVLYGLTVSPFSATRKISAASPV
jgi:predicted PurR-regulated permease PerM